MAVVPCIDQLGIYPHAVACSLHTALKQMRHAELSSNFAEIARHLALVLHHTRTADYLQVRDLRQIRQNLVLHSVRKKGVVRITAEIVERQNGNTFFRNGGSVRYRRRRRNRRCAATTRDWRRTSRPDD